MRRPTSVLLGAGASMDAGLPSAIGLTTRLVGATALQRETTEDRLVYETLKFVHDGVKAGFNADECPDAGEVDVETVMTALLLLSTRDISPLSPFVERWQPWFPSTLVDGEFVAAETAFDLTFVKCLDHLVNLLREIGDTRYLEPILRACRPDGYPLSVATLNYDLTFEAAAQGFGTTLDRGVSNYSNDFVYEWNLDVDVRLLKLHGSIDWKLVHGGGPSLLSGQLRIGDDAVWKTLSDFVTVPAVIIGGQNKLRAAGPFLRLYATWEHDLSLADDLLIVGYSMRDEHINEVIRRWLFANSGHRLAVVEPDWHPKPMSFSWEISELLTPQHRLIVVEKPATTGIPEALEKLAKSPPLN